MKIKGFYDKHHGAVWGPRCMIVKSDKEYHINYSRYLANAIHFLRSSEVKEILNAIEELENDKIEVYDYDTDIFFYDIYKDRVEFEPLYNEDWGYWSCPMIEYKRALLGWGEFLKLPKSEDSYMEIEINDL